MANTAVESIELDAVILSSNKSVTEIVQIPRIDCEVSYHELFEKYLFANQPCIIGNFVSENWKSRQKWVLNDKPNFKELQNTYGYVEVPIADCRTKYFNVQKKSNSTLKDFLNYWDDFIIKDHNDNLPCLYMKDWHFTRDFPDDEVYRVPQYFASDWLNEYLTEKKSENCCKDDYRFIYMGPKGSWTPLHADVFTSFSWSVNVCGKKRWLLFPPGQENFLRNKFNELAYDTTSPEMQDEKLYPNFQKLGISYDVIQESGEAIFVPSGWHHQVWNLEDTISVNHNWINGCNAHSMWQSIRDNLESVKSEIEDCKEMDDWTEHCQVMLRATYGMNYGEFFSLLKFITEKRINFLLNNVPIEVFGDWLLGENHALFDLLQLKKILCELLSDSDFQKLIFYNDLSPDKLQFVTDLETILLQKNVQ